jgi:hypothetical protein
MHYKGGKMAISLIDRKKENHSEQVYIELIKRG